MNTLESNNAALIAATPPDPEYLEFLLSKEPDYEKWQAARATPPPTESLHNAAIATADANHWPHAYALGYMSGLEDCHRRRDPEHGPRERDDYARGYVLGYSDGIALAALAKRKTA